MRDRNLITSDRRSVTIITLKNILFRSQTLGSLGDLGFQIVAVTRSAAARQYRNIGADQKSQIRILRDPDMTGYAVLIVVIFVFVIKFQRIARNDV